MMNKVKELWKIKNGLNNRKSNNRKMKYFYK